MASALPVNVTCPVCGASFIARIHNILDVGRHPELKVALLQGKVNLATCPKCQQSGMLATPLLYHDPAKELLLVFVPDRLNVKAEEREKLIGSLVNTLINSIPAEQRKAYLLQPKTFFALDRVMEEILQADGITPEMIEAQRQAINLLQQLLAAKDNAESLKTLAEQQRDKLDYEFFLLLSAAIDAANQEGDARRAEQLADLRDKLLELVVPPLPEPLPAGATRQDLVEKLLQAEDDEALEGLVISNRPMVDYLFFQTLTERIEALENAGDAQAARLKDVRDKVLDVTDQLNQEAQAAQRETVDLISGLLASQNLDTAISEHPEAYDGLFFIMLSGMAESASKSGQKELADKLQDLGQRVVAFLEEQMPPELRLINQLLTAEYPQGTAKLLQEQSSQLTEELVAAMRAIAADLEKQRQPNTARKLRDIAEQAASLLAGKTVSPA